MKDIAKDIDDKSKEITSAESFIISPLKKNSDSISIENAITGRTTGRNLIKYNCLKRLIKAGFVTAKFYKSFRNSRGQ